MGEWQGFRMQLPNPRHPRMGPPLSSTPRNLPALIPAPTLQERNKGED